MATAPVPNTHNSAPSERGSLRPVGEPVPACFLLSERGSSPSSKVVRRMRVTVGVAGLCSF